MSNDQQQANDQFEVLKLQLKQREESLKSGKPLPFPTELTQIIHAFAEQRYEPARELFMDLLEKNYPDPLITESLVMAVGFHWTDVKKIVPILVNLLREHKSVLVRMHCAGALGSFDTDEAIQPLVNVICDQEEDEDVIEAAKSSLMELSSLPITKRERVATGMANHCGELGMVKDKTSLIRLLNQFAGANSDTDF